MARTGFYYENRFRDYPFVAYTAQRTQESESSASVPHELPESAVVDAGFILGLEAQYEDATDRVYLHRARLVPGQIEFEFRTTAPSAADEAVTFHIPLASLFLPQWADSRPIDPILSSSSAGSAVLCALPKWRGFLVGGDLSDLQALLETVGSLDYGPEWQIEPGRIQNLNQAFVSGISLANFARTQVTPPAACDSESSSATGPPEVLLNSRCLQGALLVRAGYNCAILQDSLANSLEIGAVLGAGLGLPCNEVPLYPEEAAPPNSQLLTGGPACNEVVQTVNGKGGSTLQITTGPGLSITTPEDQPHTLIITATLARANGGCQGG